MKPIFILTLVLLTATASGIAVAQTDTLMTAPAMSGSADVAVTDTPTDVANTDPVLVQVAYVQSAWADIKYGPASDEQKLAALATLEQQAAALVATNPTRAEPMIWDAIILSTQAGIIKGVSALPKVKRAKALLEASLQHDPTALDGSAHTSLGSLYYQVPGWPIGFGDSKKAEQHLKAALKLNPDGIDPNYFYGDFLIKQDRFAEAMTALHHAQAAPPRPGRENADAGRQREIAEALTRAQAGAAKAKKSAFN